MDKQLNEQIWFICQDVRLRNLSEQEATDEILACIKEAGYRKVGELLAFARVDIEGQPKNRFYDGYKACLKDLLE